MLPEPEPDNLPKDPVIPVPLPAPHKVTMLTAGGLASLLAALSMVTMIFSIAPAVAPVLGGWVVTLFDWRAIFLGLLGFTLVLWWMCWQHLPETMPPERRQPFNPRYLARNYWDIFSSVLFQMKSGVVALNFGGMFLFIAGAPVLLPVHLHLGPSQFAWLFVPAVSGIFLGALAANRLAGRMTFSRQIAIGYVLMGGAVIFTVTYHSLFPPALPWTVLPMFFYNFGSSIINPSATLLALDLFPHIRGTVASCQSFVTTLMGVLVAGFIAPSLN